MTFLVLDPDDGPLVDIDPYDPDEAAALDALAFLDAPDEDEDLDLEWEDDDVIILDPREVVFDWCLLEYGDMDPNLALRDALRGRTYRDVATTIMQRCGYDTSDVVSVHTEDVLVAVINISRG